MSERIDFTSGIDTPKWFKHVVLNLPKEELMQVVSDDAYDKSNLQVEIRLNDRPIRIHDFNKMIDGFVQRSIAQLSDKLVAQQNQLNYERNTFDEQVNEEVARRLQNIAERVANGELTGVEKDV